MVRPSLDCDDPGPSCPSAISGWLKDHPLNFPNRGASPGNRCVLKRPAPCHKSTDSDRSIKHFINFQDDPRCVMNRDCPRCASMASHMSKKHFVNFQDGPPSGDPSLRPSEGPSAPELDSVFTHLHELMMAFVNDQLTKFHQVLALDSPECLVNGGDEEAFLNITLDFLKKMQQRELAERLQNRSNSAACQGKLKSHLQQKFSSVCEGVAKAGNTTLLNQIYTELYITEGGASEINQKHEVRYIETVSRKPDATESSITCEDLFKYHPGHIQGPIKTVLTVGVAGVGKTVLTQKFSLDWAEGRAHQDVQLLFPFTFRELNVLRESKYSLVGLVHHFFSQTKGFCSFQQLQVLFIFDGLDECRLPLDFSRTRVLTEPTESASVEELLVNLIRGDLLPSARLWITTRPAAANQIPAQYISMVTEVRGFTDQQKELYFRKRFRDEQQATAVISHIKATRSLDIMSLIPLFCWISASVLDYLIKNESTDQLPHTLTQMYIHFLVVQAKVKNIKYHEGTGADLHWTPQTREMVLSLGKLAFEQLLKGNLIFYESDLSECGLDAAEIARYSGVFTQVFREEPGLYQDKVYCFIHLSVQEFLAALHVHQTFVKTGVNLLLDKQSSFSTLRNTNILRKNPNLKHLHQSAVDQALQSPNGHLDLFLRFLVGLSLPTNQSLLHGLLAQTDNSKTNVKTVRYIVKKINEEFQAERSINLFHCLHELNEDSFMKEIEQSFNSRKLLEDHLSPAEWSAVAFLLLSSKNQEGFNLANKTITESALQRLLPVVKASNTITLSGCDLSRNSCSVLASTLGSSSSSLKELILDHNPLHDSGVERLCSGLRSSDCKLEALSLCVCDLTGKSCSALASVLRSESSLKLLDLSNNHLQDMGVKLLCEGLQSAPCRLETLRLSGCMISEEGGALITTALMSTTTRLKELDLSYNYPGSSTVKQLKALHADPQSSLDTLRLEPIGMRWLNPGLRKYFCELTLDLNRTVMSGSRRVVCRPALSGRCYWEVDWSLGVGGGAAVDIAVSTKQDLNKESIFGRTDQSWCLRVNRMGYSVRHNKTKPRVYSFAPSDGPLSGKVAVYLDCPAGSISFYEICNHGLMHIYSFQTTFSERLYAGFGLFTPESSFSLV